MNLFLSFYAEWHQCFFVSEGQVFLGYSPTIAQKIGATLAKLQVVVLIHKPSISNRTTNTDPDDYVASFVVEVGTNSNTSDIEATAVAEQLFALLHKYNPSELRGYLPCYEIVSTGMQSAGEGVYLLDFTFPYLIEK